MPAAEDESVVNELVFTRVLDAPRDLVFDAWTQPQHIARWWGPRGFSTTTHVMEVEVGGRWNYVMHGPDGTDYPSQGIFLEVLRPERWVLSNVGGKVDDPHLTCEMHATFEALQGKTKLTLRMRFRSAEAVVRARKQGVEDGGNETLARLADFVGQASR